MTQRQTRPYRNARQYSAARRECFEKMQHTETFPRSAQNKDANNKIGEGRSGEAKLSLVRRVCKPSYPQILQSDKASEKCVIKWCSYALLLLSITCQWAIARHRPLLKKDISGTWWDAITMLGGNRKRFVGAKQNKKGGSFFVYTSVLSHMVSIVFEFVCF